MKLFEIDNSNNVVINPEIREIPGFKAIINRDRTPSKSKAMKELLFIYYYCDYKSDCHRYEDPAKTQLAMELSGLPKDWTPDKLITEAISTYNHQDSDAVVLLKAARFSAMKLADYFKTVDLNEVNEKGILIHKASDLVRNMQMIGNVVKGLKELEDQVKVEQLGDSRIRGGGKKGMFEDEEDEDD